MPVILHVLKSCRRSAKGRQWLHEVEARSWLAKGE
jgi:hypothetical protein